MTKKAMRRSMKAIVGLGNPGERYAHTRHNVGFWVVDAMGVDVQWRAFEFCTWGEVADDLVLVKPLTYMNNSGLAAAQIARCFGVAVGDMLVVVDDVHLAVGRLRFRRAGSRGGHNGLWSIERELGSSDFRGCAWALGSPQRRMG